MKKYTVIYVNWSTEIVDANLAITPAYYDDIFHGNKWNVTERKTGKIVKEGDSDIDFVIYYAKCFATAMAGFEYVDESGKPTDDIKRVYAALEAENIL